MLPICIGDATKLSQCLLDADKCYRVEMQLGVRTTTGDSEGEVISQRPLPILTREQFVSFLQRFVGEQLQIPPMHSAIKHQGQPLYRLARKGIEVLRSARKIRIYSMELQEFSKSHATVEVYCSKGTYIRTIVDDLGQIIGCGAHVIGLHRLASGEFTEALAISLPKLESLTTQTDALSRCILPTTAMIQPYSKNYG